MNIPSIPWLPIPPEPSPGAGPAQEHAAHPAIASWLAGAPLDGRATSHHSTDIGLCAWPAGRPRHGDGTTGEPAGGGRRGSGRPAGPTAGAARPTSPHPESGRAWLRGAMAALAALAGAAAVVSWDAQYVMVRAARPDPLVAALEAGIPDGGALIFATLGIALALHGRRALRPRALNLACVAISLTMNAMAAAPGWRDAAIWVMPAAVYALASDTLIGVVRAWALARMRSSGEPLTGEEVTPLAVVGACLLWVLRLGLAPASTLAGFRRWVVDECPVAPGRKALPALPAGPAATPLVLSAPAAEQAAPALPGSSTHSPAGPRPDPEARGADFPAAHAPRRRKDGRPRKQDLLIALASQRHDLRRLPLGQVARIATQIGAEVDLHPGTARRVLKAHVHNLQRQAGGPPGTRPVTATATTAYAPAADPETTPTTALSPGLVRSRKEQ